LITSFEHVHCHEIEVDFIA